MSRLAAGLMQFVPAPLNPECAAITVEKDGQTVGQIKVMRDRTLSAVSYALTPDECPFGPSAPILAARRVRTVTEGEAWLRERAA